MFPRVKDSAVFEESRMSSYEKSPRTFGHRYRHPRPEWFSGSLIIMAVVTFAVLVTTVYIFHYSYSTTSDVVEQSDLLPTPRWTANPTPAAATAPPLATPKS
jgi:hypothetical protein